MRQFLVSFLLVAMAGAMLPGLGLMGFLIVGAALLYAMSPFGKLRMTRRWYDYTNGVTVDLVNGQLGGALITSDGVVGMVLTGASETGYTVGDCLLVTGLDNLVEQHITEANNPFAYRQVKEFYDQAGAGAQLYLMLVTTATSIASMADNTNANGAKKLWLFAQGKIKVMGLMTDDKAIAAVPTVITITTGLNALVYTALANAKVFVTACRAAQKPLRVIIGGTSYSGVPADLVDETSGTSNNAAAILIGDTQSYDATNSSAALGLLMGRIASIPVQQAVSRVATGPLTNTAVYLKTTAIESLGSDPDTIAGKGFITFQVIPNLAGYFFTGDPMCTATTDDYKNLGRCRMIDKAQILAYTTFVQSVDDDVPMNEDGTINGGFAKHLEAKMEEVIRVSMKTPREISGVKCTIDTSQNVLQTEELEVVLKIIPMGRSKTITIKLGLATKF